MALTANPQSALPPPLWDENIVPALRKRLQDESRVLAKRISSSSIGGADDSHYDIYDAYADPQYPRPTAIPRPSISTGRPSISESTRPPSATSSRSRTYSQPKLYDRSTSSAKATASPPLPRTSFTSSHGNTATPTRIPMARTRTGSVSSYAATATASPSSVSRSESRNGTAAAYGNGSTSPALSSTTDLRKVAERGERSPLARTGRETAYDQDPPRPSVDSEERPYEHWYRGEVSRNGGVGEYRVVRRQEMLDIANYGHKAAANSHLQVDSSNWQNGTMNRRRRNSTGARARESFYLDPEANGTAERVLDEAPPSGLDSDEARSVEYDEPDAADGDELPSHSPTPTSQYSHYSRSETLPAPIARQNTEPPRTPTPTRSRAPPSQGTPKAMAMSSSASAPGSSARSQTATPQSQNKRRAKSPATETPPSSKKKPKPVPQKKREEEVRMSVAAYPVPDDDADMSNAIPTWTQPVPTTGNWDDVVLPVVARKKGLDGHYVQADGSPQPKPAQEKVFEPAPGTFGFDYSKYKPASWQPESIPMDEFGQQHRPPPVAEYHDEDGSHATQNATPQASPPMPPPVDTRNARANVPEPPRSPAPFSHYQMAPAHPDAVAVEMNSTRVPMERPQQQDQHLVDDGGNGGCCQCVIM